MAWKVNLYRGYLAICNPDDHHLNVVLNSVLFFSHGSLFKNLLKVRVLLPRGNSFIFFLNFQALGKSWKLEFGPGIYL